MRKNNHNTQRKTGAGATGPATRTTPPVHTAGQRETLRQRLRIMARIIARAHLRRETSRARSAPSPDQGAGG